MNRSELQALSRMRQREAKALLHAREFNGAYYVLGYAVECALKARIAKETRRHDFPDKEFASKVFVHKLEALLGHAGLAIEFKKETVTNKPLELNWAVVKDWDAEDRYDLTTTETDARDLYAACTARNNGILHWIRRRW